MNLASVYTDLCSVGIPITAVHKHSEMSYGSLEINNQYILSLSKYDTKYPLILMLIDSDGSISEGPQFNSTNNLIQFVMEN